MSNSTDIVTYNASRRLARIGLARSIYNRMARYRNRFYFNVGTRGRMSTSARQKYGRRSQTMTRRGMKNQTKGGVTTQRDSRTIYVRRRMNGRGRRRWKKFRGKVLAVAEKDLGSLTAVITRQDAASTTVGTNQIVTEYSLYAGHAGNTGAPHNDMYNIAYFQRNADNTVAKGLAVGNSSKVLFQSAVLDMTIRNSTTYKTAAGLIYDSQGKLEVDVYEITMNNPGADGDAQYALVKDMLDGNLLKTDMIGGANVQGSEVSINLRGVTPWDCTFALSRYGIRIWRKTKYIIPVNDEITYQIRDPKRHVFTLDDMNKPDAFNYKGKTRFVFLIAKLAPGLAIGTEVGNWQPTLNIGATKKYMYKVENVSEDRTVYYVQP